MQRLSRERLNHIRADLAQHYDGVHTHFARELIEEIDAMLVEQAELEQRGRVIERTDVCAWITKHADDLFLEAFHSDWKGYKPSVGERAMRGADRLANVIESAVHVGEAAKDD